MTYVRDLAEIRLSDDETVGGKGANLGELISAGFTVPGGFVISRDGYWAALEHAGVRAELADLHAKAVANVDDTTALSEACDRMRDLVRLAGLTGDLRDEIAAAYHGMGGSTPVAIRSSATGEDGAEASFAGMNATYTNI
jgi:pyruvate,water dikinase